MAAVSYLSWFLARYGPRRDTSEPVKVKGAFDSKRPAQDGEDGAAGLQSRDTHANFTVKPPRSSQRWIQGLYDSAREIG